MSFTYVTRTGDGNKRSFTFSFVGQDEGYIRQDDILVTVDGEQSPFTLISPNSIELESAPPSGSEVIIRRVMPKDVPFADFSRGNNFGQDILNNSFLQLLYVVHELLDGWFPEGFTVREAVDYLEGLRAFSPDPNDPKSVVNFEAGDDRYVEVSGDTMQGSLNMASYPVFVRIAINGNEPARKDQLDAERIQRQSADDNLQSQISDTQPLEASAFSPISWHKQEIENSLSIPANMNAWSFGPSMTIAEGQSVSISDNSYWTVANGDGETTSINYDGGYL